MKPDRPSLPKLRPIDYAILFGMPVVFMAITVFGLIRVVGPIPQPSAVQRIKDGEVKSGDSLDSVLKRLGQPKSVTSKDDGSMTVIYTRTVADGDLQIEEGVISLDASAHVIETHVDRQLPTKPQQNNSAATQ